MLISSKIAINFEMVKSVSPFSKRESCDVDIPAFSTSFKRKPLDSRNFLKISPNFFIISLQQAYMGTVFDF